MQVRVLLRAFIPIAGVAKLVDAPDSESGEQSWGFESLHPHHPNGPFVYGLGRLVLSQEKRVRLSYGLPIDENEDTGRSLAW